jgi:hypothetical protein
MSWTQVIAGMDPKIANDCRAGILVGCRLPISEDPEAALAVQGWTKSQPGVELWIVDDLLGLAPQQLIYVGIPIVQAFGLGGDHREGIALDVLEECSAAATARMTILFPELSAVQTPGPVGTYFVWSGPLCGGFLVKGVFRDEYKDEDVWYDSEAPCKMFLASRGARQDPAEGGVLGVDLFHTIYDCSDEPPELTAELLRSGDERLAAAGLLKDARIHVLPHYD